MTDGAMFSDDGHYRYTLCRTVHLAEETADKGLVVFVMLNPSTADAERDDPTIRKCISLARAWGYGQLKVVNLFAYKSPKPRDLATIKSKDLDGGSPNDKAILEAVEMADKLVCAWGSGGSLPAVFKREVLQPRVQKVLEIVKNQRKKPYTISENLTGANQPQHPKSLHFPEDTRPKLWDESRWPGKGVS